MGPFTRVEGLVVLGGGLAWCHMFSSTPLLSPPQLASECYALLPSLGAGFTQGLKYTECWEQQTHCLLATLHSLLGTLYEGLETGAYHWSR